MEIWEKTLASDNFWPSMSAIGTLAAVIVALFLPFLLNTLRRLRITSTIIEELSVNRRLIEKISEHAPENGKFSSKQKLEINGTAIHLSADLWQTKRFEMSRVPYRCLLPYYRFAEIIIDPVRYTAVEDNRALDTHTQAKIRYDAAKAFLRELEQTAKKCRYLREI